MKKKEYRLSFSSTTRDLYEFEEILKKKCGGHGCGFKSEDISFYYNTLDAAVKAFKKVKKYTGVEDIIISMVN